MKKTILRTVLVFSLSTLCVCTYGQSQSAQKKTAPKKECKSNCKKECKKGSKKGCTKGCDKMSKGKNHVRLMTYNIATWTRDPNEAYNYQTIANMVNEKNADLVCLNEVDSVTTRTNKEYQLQKFAATLGNWDFQYGNAMPYLGGAYGEGIATKEKALKKYVVHLPKGVGAEPRVGVIMELKKYVIVTTHLDHAVEAAHIDQVKVLTDFVKKLYQHSKKPVFLGGDLNAEPTSPTLKKLEELGWKRLSGTDCTFPSNAPDVCIDYFMQYQNGVKVNVDRAYVATDFTTGNARTASDHLPVIVDVSW